MIGGKKNAMGMIDLSQKTVTKEENDALFEGMKKMEESRDINNTLAEREKRYGNFLDHASITQSIKEEMSESRNWKLLDVDKKEALEMIAHKIGRILNGDPCYKDSWRDIEGYAKLISDTLEEEKTDDDFSINPISR